MSFMVSTTWWNEESRCIIDINRQLNLNLEKEDFKELLDSHVEELTNEDLMHLEQQREGEEDPFPVKKFEPKLMAVALSKY